MIKTSLMGAYHLFLSLKYASSVSSNSEINGAFTSKGDDGEKLKQSQRNWHSFDYKWQSFLKFYSLASIKDDMTCTSCS